MPGSKSKSRSETAQKYLFQALAHYDRKGYADAMKCLSQSIMTEPFQRVAYTLLLKSVIYLIFTESVVNILKQKKRSFNQILDYIEYVSLKQKLAGIKMDTSENNVLFIVRDMGVGGVTKINLDIIKGIQHGPFKFHVAATSPVNNTWCDKFTSCSQTVIIPQREISSTEIWGKYFSQIIRKLNISIVVVSNAYIGYQVLPYLKSEFPSVKTVDILHMEGMWGTTELSKWTIPYFDKRILISNMLKNYMTKQYADFRVAHNYTERFDVIYNGIDVSRYRPAEWRKGSFKERFGIQADTRIISFIGRFTPQKLPGLFVDIANNIIERQPAAKLKFVMLGDGEEFVNTRNTIEKYGIEDHFILIDMIDNVAELLADTYLLLLVSQNEGVPMVMFEAMLMEVPVICSDVGAIHEVIKDRFNGCLIGPGGNFITSVTDTVLDFISGKLNYSGIAEQGRDTIASRFSLDAMMLGYEAAFTELIKE